MPGRRELLLCRVRGAHPVCLLLLLEGTLARQRRALGGLLGRDLLHQRGPVPNVPAPVLVCRLQAVRRRGRRRVVIVVVFRTVLFRVVRWVMMVVVVMVLKRG